MYTMLGNSNAIYRKLEELFSKKTRNRQRVIIVAYVGADAPSLLPDVKNVKLYCWPQAGSTNPHAIRKLIKSGARIYFVDKLHMKLYWVEGEGVVITSANFSQNGLGVGRLYEFGAYLNNPLDLNIDDVIKSLASRSVTSRELQELHRQHDLYMSRNPKRKWTSKERLEAPNFTELDRDQQKAWKLGWWEEDDEWHTAGPIRLRAQKEYKRKTDVYDGLYCKKEQYQEGDWVLCFKVFAQSKKLINPDPYWMFIDIVGVIPKGDKGYVDSRYPYQAVQVAKRAKNMVEPFRLDEKFKKAFQFAVEKYGISKLMGLRNLSPKEEFLKILVKQLAQQEI